MARIQTSSLISNISGKLNGSVFQRTQGGLTLRNRNTPVNSNSPRSNLRKVGMATVQNDWQTLTPAERTLWQVYSTYIQKKQKKNVGLNINGHQLFININSVRFDLSSSNVLFQPYLLVTPKLIPLPQIISVDAVSEGFGDLRVAFHRVVDSSKEVIICFASRPLKSSEQSANQRMVLMKSPTLNESYISIYDYYVSVFGRTAYAGEYIQVKVAIYSTDSENYSSYCVFHDQLI